MYNDAARRQPSLEDSLSKTLILLEEKDIL